MPEKTKHVQFKFLHDISVMDYYVTQRSGNMSN
jgi:hypothetical protein